MKGQGPNLARELYPLTLIFTTLLLQTSESYSAVEWYTFKWTSEYQLVQTVLKPEPAERT